MSSVSLRSRISGSKKEIGNEVTKRTPPFSVSGRRSKEENDDEKQELKFFADEIKTRPHWELERDLVELNYDIEFLEAQIRCCISEYSPSNLEQAKAKISMLKKKYDLIRLEYERKVPRQKDAV